jgi:predicted RNA-binding Zn ribbon-like protein
MSDGAAEADPRPLTGEPVSVDLLNTTWVDAAGSHDLLAGLPGLAVWLRGQGWHDAPQTEATRTALVGAREALRRHVTGDEDARAELNAVLARGSLVRTLGDGGPTTRVEVADPSDLPAWTAVEDYLRLLERDPHRIRLCAGPGCVLHFFDVSKRGERRWCSMAGCGNRAKAARHYARTRRPAGRDHAGRPDRGTSPGI